MTRQTLPAGQYWLVNSNGRLMTVRSCPPFGVNLIASDKSSSSTVNGNLLAKAPFDIRVRNQLRLVIKSFRAGSRVRLV